MQQSQKCVFFATGMHKYHTHLVLHKCHTPLAHTRIHAHTWAHTRAFRYPKQKNFFIERIRNESPTTRTKQETTKKESL